MEAEQINENMLPSPGACFSTININDPSISYKQHPVSLLKAFHSCCLSPPNRKPILEAFFAAQGFRNSTLLATLLEDVCISVEELFSEDTAGSQETCQFFHNHVFSRLKLQQLKVIVAMAQKHMKEFENIGVLRIENGQTYDEGLQMPSLVYSEVSQSTRASLKFRSSLPIDSHADSSQQFAQHIQSLEEFALVLSLKDCLLSVLSPGSSEQLILITMLSEMFTNCDLQGLLAHESSVRQGLAIKALNNESAEASAKESRAASAMQTLLDENSLSESMCSLVKFLCRCM